MKTDKPDKDPLQEAHDQSFRNRECLQASAMAGCFYCLQVYPAGHVHTWTDTRKTALCPRCGMDSVIGDAAPFPVKEPDFLQAMHKEWFEKTITLEELKAKLNRSRLRTDSKRVRRRPR